MLSPTHSAGWKRHYRRMRPHCRKTPCFRQTSCSLRLLLLPQTVLERASAPTPPRPPTPSWTTRRSHPHPLPSRKSSIESGRWSEAGGAAFGRWRWRPTAVPPSRSCGGRRRRRCCESRGNRERSERLSPLWRGWWSSRRWRGCSRCPTGIVIFAADNKGRGQKGETEGEMYAVISRLDAFVELRSTQIVGSHL